MVTEETGWDVKVGAIKDGESKLLLTLEDDGLPKMELHITKEEAKELFFNIVEIITNRGGIE